MSVVRFVVIAVLFIGLLFISLDNADTVTLRFFHLGQLQAPLIFVVLCAFAVGVALGLASGALRTARVKRELKQARREMKLRDDAARTSAQRTMPPMDAV
ncbi:MAG: LapA family protein [Betaproteobacteria bacterium]